MRRGSQEKKKGGGERQNVYIIPKLKSDMKADEIHSGGKRSDNNMEKMERNIRHKIF